MTREQWDALPFNGRAKVWPSLTAAEKDLVRDLSGLSPQLIGLEGARVEVVSDMTGDKERFWVSRSSGWQPCHIALKTRMSTGGFGCSMHYASVRVIRWNRREQDRHRAWTRSP